jgi:hypothetical protein
MDQTEGSRRTASPGSRNDGAENSGKPGLMLQPDFVIR